MDINVVIEKLSMLMLIMVFGYIARKKNIINDEHNKGFSVLIVNITAPCLILASMLSTKSDASKSQVLSIIFLGAIIYAILIIISNFIPKLFKADKLEDGVYRFCTIFNNNIFMGFPIIQSMLGEGALFFAAILNIPITLFMFSVGIYNMSKHRGDGKFSLKKIINPGIISSFVGLILYFIGVDLPPMLDDALKSVGNITVPLSMVVLGCTLATMSAKEVFEDIKIYLFCLIKMVILPLISFLIISKLGLDKMILYVIIISLAMPGPTLCVSLAIDFEANVKLASKYVFLSTVLSLVTIPLVIKMII